MAAETHIISKVPLDSMSWVSRKNMTRQCGISVRPVDITAGLDVQTFNLYGSLFDSVSGSTVAESEIPSDGSRKLFLVSEDQTDGTLEALMKAHRRPSEVAKVELDIPYSVVDGEATVTSVKLYAVSADSGSDNDITEKLTSKYYLKNAGYTIPTEFEGSNDEVNLIATCDLSQPGVATGDITDFLKTTNYPTMALNIAAVVEVEGTAATFGWCPGVGPSVRFTTDGSPNIHFSRQESMAEKFAYFRTTIHPGNSDLSGRISVELSTGLATIETDTNNDVVSAAINGTQKVTELDHRGSIDGVTYLITFEVRSKLYAGQSTILYKSATADNAVIPISATGEFTLNNPVTDDTGLFQPAVQIPGGADIDRFVVSSPDYDPSTAITHHSLEFTSTHPGNRGYALLRDIEDKPVLAGILSNSTSALTTGAKISRLYISGDSQYTDQYGTESRTISFT